MRLASPGNAQVSGMVILVITLIPSWVMTACQQSDTGAALSQQGLAKAENGDYQAAIRDFDQVIQRNPNLAAAYFHRALFRRKLGDEAGAIADYGQVLRLSPDNGLAYNNRCAAQIQLKQYSLALADCDQAVRLQPQNFLPYSNRCEVRYRLDDPQAIQDCDLAISLKPTSALAYKTRGLARHHFGRSTLARQDLQKAIQLFADQGDVENHQLASEILQAWQH